MEEKDERIKELVEELHDLRLKYRILKKKYVNLENEYYKYLIKYGSLDNENKKKSKRGIH